VANHTFHCHRLTGHGAQNFIQGIQNSCNPVFIAVGQRIGGTLFNEYIQGFGFGEPSGIDLPGEEDGIIQPVELLEKPGMVELSSNSFGQSFKVTPLQMVTSAAATVNGGRLMRPYIVRQVLDSDGNVLETTQPLVRRQVISEQTSETMRSLAEAVVDGGSGRNAAIPGYRIGGKTGTSEKLDIRDRDVNVLSFCGFAPMEDPRYAVLVMLDEPALDAQAAFGSTIAAPIVGAVMQEMLPYLGVEPQYTPEQLEMKDVLVPDVTGMKPHDAQGERITPLGLKIRIEGEGPEIIRQIPQAKATMPKGGTIIVFTDEESIKTGITVPDVVGMTAKAANTALLEAGLNIELRGYYQDGVPNVVTEQWPLAGESATTGDVVVVTLRGADVTIYVSGEADAQPAEPDDPALEYEPEEPPEDEERYYGDSDFVMVVPRE
jgi:stage V sporulation protein D (sporulation-specific penicillin-binding protein)